MSNLMTTINNDTKRILTLIALCAAVVPGAAHAQADSKIAQWRTCNFFNGRLWHDAASDSQSSYLIGLRDMDSLLTARQYFATKQIIPDPLAQRRERRRSEAEPEPVLSNSRGHANSNFYCRWNHPRPVRRK